MPFKVNKIIYIEVLNKDIDSVLYNLILIYIYYIVFIDL